MLLRQKYNTRIKTIQRLSPILIRRLASSKIPPNSNNILIKDDEDFNNKMSIPRKIWHEIKFYYTGTKILIHNIRQSRAIIKKKQQNQQVHWREDRLLRQTKNDLTKVVPFLGIAMIPLSEFFLPIIIRTFPSLLPSTYQNEEQKKELYENNYYRKLRSAQQIQKSIRVLLLDNLLNNLNEQDTIRLLQKLRNKEYLYNSEIILLNQKYDFDIGQTKRSDLFELCNYFHIRISKFSSNENLRATLLNYLNHIREEDYRIKIKEIDEFNLDLLIKLNSERGMRVFGQNSDILRQQLRDWIQLSRENVSPLLLLISRSLNFNSKKLRLMQFNSKEQDESEEETQIISTVSSDLTEEELKVEIKEQQKLNDELTQKSNNSKLNQINKIPEKVAQLEDS